MNMRQVILLFLLLQLSFLNAQVFKTNTLEVNNIKIGLQANGDMHRDSLLVNSISEFPNGSGNSCVYTQSLWLGGYDENSELRLGASTYRQVGIDFWPGPIADNYDSLFDVKYNQVWHLTKNDIEFHMNNYNSVGYTMSLEIETWPANGDLVNGESQNLAPYEDINANNIYEPEQGEYPLIRGDEALYVIYNDSKQPHTYTGGMKIGVEIHQMKDLDLTAISKFKNPLYISLDMDAFDPAFAPGVSHHEPGGLSSRDVISLIQNIDAEVVGADIVEYNPNRDFQNMTAFLAAKMMKEILVKMM